MLKTITLAAIVAISAINAVAASASPFNGAQSLSDRWDHYQVNQSLTDGN